MDVHSAGFSKRNRRFERLAGCGGCRAFNSPVSVFRHRRFERPGGVRVGKVVEPPSHRAPSLRMRQIVQSFNRQSRFFWASGRHCTNRTEGRRVGGGRYGASQLDGGCRDGGRQGRVADGSLAGRSLAAGRCQGVDDVGSLAAGRRQGGAATSSLAADQLQGRSRSAGLSSSAVELSAVERLVIALRPPRRRPPAVTPAPRRTVRADTGRGRGRR